MTPRALSRLVPLVTAGLISHALAAATPAVVQLKAHKATFEFVVHRFDPDPLTYERPLPWDLVPFSIRNDSYWSIGTAFAIGPNTFVTAGHVLLETIGGQYATPALRDSDGHTYPIDRVLKFSLHQDFAVFTVGSAPALQALTANRTRRPGQTVFAVGNALGQGVVVRDGLLTSETPEDQDGRWKWLRYSAAASPGSSGGPLLDSSGAVVGVITAKSPSENLNYALPIGEVLDAKPSLATFDARQSMRLPILHDTSALQIKDQFDLPKTFGDFAVAFQQTLERSYAGAIGEALSAHQGELFPLGDSAKVLAMRYSHPIPTFLSQNDDKSWQAPGPEDLGHIDLAGRGHVSTGSTHQIQFFHLVRPDQSSTDDFYDDPKAFSDLLLKGVKISRPIANEAVRITSLGPIQSDELHKDRNGRLWQLRSWWLGYTNAYFFAFCLPTPDGYVGFTQVVPGVLLRPVTEFGKLIADYTLATYSGTPPQWKTFLAREKLRPAPFDRIKVDFDQDKGLRYESARLVLDLPKTVVPISDRSELELMMGFAEQDKAYAWDVVGIVLREDIDRAAQLRILRQSRPASAAGQELERRWDQLSKRKSPFDGVAQRLAPPDGYAINTSIGAPWSAERDGGVNVLYEVGSQVDTPALPRDLEDRQRAVVRGLRVLEH